MRTIPFETLPGSAGHAYRPVSQGRRGIFGVFGTIFETLLAWQQRAVERQQMRGMTDEMLRDIGYSRADIDEASKPFWVR